MMKEEHEGSVEGSVELSGKKKKPKKDMGQQKITNSFRPIAKVAGSTFHDWSGPHVPQWGGGSKEVG